MKTLFISNYQERSGYSQAGQDYIMALDAANIHVVPRRINLNVGPGEVKPRILELEKNNHDNPEVVIQYTLPHYMEYCGKIPLNVGMFDWETTGFYNNLWAEKLNTMDLVIVPSEGQKQACINSGVTKPIEIVGHPVDNDKFGYYPKLDIPALKGGKYVFYTIGEFNRRKNFQSLIESFHIAFDKDEPVELVIKTGIHGKSPVEAADMINNFVAEVKSGLKLYRSPESYKKEVLITAPYTESDICSLHRTCDCFVLSSYGEGWSLPAMDAMGFGNPLLASKTMGVAEYLTEQNGIPIKSYEKPVFGVNNAFEDLYLGNETWHEIDTVDLSKAMRRIYEDKQLHKDLSWGACDTILNYSYGQIGYKLKKVIEKYL